MADPPGATSGMAAALMSAFARCASKGETASASCAANRLPSATTSEPQVISCVASSASPRFHNIRESQAIGIALQPSDGLVERVAIATDSVTYRAGSHTGEPCRA
jgi:hypothetical protein